MQRVLEPEVMDGEAQSTAYAQADFEEPDRAFVERFMNCYPKFDTGRMLDMGCGPAAISRYLCQALPGISVTGVDASEPMIRLGRDRIATDQLTARIDLVCGYLPGAIQSTDLFDAVISNSLLHHLPDPSVLWNEMSRLVKTGAPVLVVDLMRPQSTNDAAHVVAQYADGEPRILREDFYNSLLAAFTPEEVNQQLTDAGLSTLEVEVISDRHLAISGRL